MIQSIARRNVIINIDSRVSLLKSLRTSIVKNATGCHYRYQPYSTSNGGADGANHRQKNDVSSIEGNIKKSKYVNNDSIYVISIPITTTKSYIYCNHKLNLLHKSQLKTIPWINKVENKLSSLALKGWQKMNNSKLKVNMKITELVKRLLNTIPYEENCLKSFPSINSMIREVNEEVSKNNNVPNSKMVQSEISNLNIKKDQLKSIPLFHPPFFKPETILDQLYDFTDTSHSHHVKHAVICGIFIPISLPLALIPVVPNVPGLYLTYRLYCHIKALLGLRHLNYLLEDQTNNRIKSYEKETLADKNSVNESKHIAFQAVPILEEYYKTDNKLNDLLYSKQEDERILITPAIIEKICTGLDLPHLREDLLKALKQESSRLSKSIKIDDPVQ